MDGEVAYKRLDAHDGGDCDQLGLYIDWHCCQIDHNQLGLCINACIVKSIAISLDCVLLMSISLNWLQPAQIVHWWVYRWIDCDQLGSCIDGCQWWFRWWVQRCLTVGFDGGFDGRFNGWFNSWFESGVDGWFHLAVLGYWPQQSVRQLRGDLFTAISQEDLTGLSLNELVVLQTIIIVTWSSYKRLEVICKK